MGRSEEEMDDEEQRCADDGASSDGDPEPPPASPHQQRQRFDGTSTEIANCLRLVVTALGLHLLAYDESNKVQQSKLDVRAILRSKFQCAAMHALKNNISLSRSKVKEAAAILATEWGPGRGLCW